MTRAALAARTGPLTSAHERHPTVIRTFTDPSEFQLFIDAMVAADPLRCTLLGTSTSQLLDRCPVPMPLLAGVTRGAQVVAGLIHASEGAAYMASGAGVQFTPTELTELSDLLLSRGSITRFAGPALLSIPAAQAWSEASGRPVAQPQPGLLYRLVTFTPPPPVGSVRRIEAKDADLLADWLFRFDVFTGYADATGVPEVSGAVRAMAGNRTYLFLLDDSGTPVALAAHTSVVHGTARIGPVFTPEKERGQGYAAVITAAAVQSARALGAQEVVLFTVADYPTSNKIYARLGFTVLEQFSDILVPRHPPSDRTRRGG